MMVPQRRWMYLTAAAALGSSLTSQTGAFSPVSSFPRYRTTLAIQHHQPRPSSFPTTTATTRLYSSNRNNDSSGGFLSKLKDTAKSILPKKWFQSEEEKRAEIERKRVSKEVSGGLQEILKDAPLPIKMVGGMIAPLVSSMVGALAESMGEQQRQMDDLLEDARVYLVRDSVASQALGEPITVQPPFSQSSSTVNINGQTTSQIQAVFNVFGSRANGVARMDANENGISSLQLDVNGRSIRVSLSSSSPSISSSARRDSYSTSKLGKNPKNQGEVIDVEFVEKDEPKK